MSFNFQNFFAFKKEPFSQNISVNEIYQRPGLDGITQRIDYTIETKMITLVTGEIGAGKSTSLRYSLSNLHPSKYSVISLIASTGSINELLKQLSMEMKLSLTFNSIAKLMNAVRVSLINYSKNRQIPVIVIDEAHLLRLEVFAQLHTLFQQDFDNFSLAPLILCGQNMLVDKLKYKSSLPLASRIMGISHLEGLELPEMKKYIMHHLSIAGCDVQLFADDAVTAIQQGSGGILRKANLLAKCSLIAAARDKEKIVSAEHVRIANTEII